MREEYKTGKSGIRTQAIGWWRGCDLLDVPVGMSVVYWWPDRRKRDFSNYVKALKDALSGVVYVDDVLVASEQWVRGGYDNANPRAEVVITLLTDVERAA